MSARTVPPDAQVERDIGVLAREILTLVDASGIDPIHKPFAVLIAAGYLGTVAAASSDQMRLKVAQALISILRDVAPELVVPLPSPTQTH